MDETSMYVKLAQTVERLKACEAGTWTDLQLAILRARETKLREQLTSLLSDFSLDDLAQAERLVSNEVFKAKVEGQKVYAAAPATAVTAVKPKPGAKVK